MGDFIRKTKHPFTGEYQNAWWLENHFVGGDYGVKFPVTGEVFKAGDYVWNFADSSQEEAQTSFATLEFYSREWHHNKNKPHIKKPEEDSGLLP